MSMSKAGQDRVQIEMHNVSPTAAPVRKTNIQHLGHRNSKIRVCVCVCHTMYLKMRVGDLKPGVPSLLHSLLLHTACASPACNHGNSA